MTPSKQSAPKPNQLRHRLPKRYSWIDHGAKPRLQNVTSAGQCLYLTLLLISNRHGLSYRSETSLQSLTKLDQWQMRSARQTLIDAGLIAYTRPMYQVLALEEPSHQDELGSVKSRTSKPKRPSAEECAAMAAKLREFRQAQNR